LTAIIAYFIAGISTAAFLTLWFVTSYRELARIKEEVVAAAEMVKMHRTLYMQELGGPNMKAAKRMLDTSNMVYMEIVKSYNVCLKKPLNRLPALMLGFHYISKDEKMTEDMTAHLTNDNNNNF